MHQLRLMSPRQRIHPCVLPVFGSAAPPIVKGQAVGTLVRHVAILQILVHLQKSVMPFVREH